MPGINPTDGTVPVVVQARSRYTPEICFELIAPIDLARIFQGWGPFPAVNGASGQTGPWNAAGRTRHPQLSDGSTATESLTEYTEPSSFAYELSGFTGSMRHLFRVVRGEWTFTPDGTGTLVRWTYEFAPLRGRLLLSRALVGPLWRRYATRALELALAAVEEDAGRIGGHSAPTPRTKGNRR
ncbi:SRPBCC family protein [Leifsonia sp. AG29]|uniref:SRPBCC family protein n=1 Tax=Leifsonia sp. AG29 TaxID=2598860 RepID=UPI00131ABE03|nr:SRPBCC family protein [Leifsonia sp. AG29]